MSLRAFSGVDSLRSVERTSSLPDEYFKTSVPGHSAGDRHPSPLAKEGSHLERRNSHPLQSKDRRRASDPTPPIVTTKFPPILNGPYPNFVGQGGWSEVPEAGPSQLQQAVPEPNNNIVVKLPQASSVPDSSHKSKLATSTKKRSVPVHLNERQKPLNSYARMFAAQKQKKAKEAKENDAKHFQNGDVDQGGEATEHLSGQKHDVHMDTATQAGHTVTGQPVDNGIHPSYDHTLELAERTRKELQDLDSQIEYHKFMAQSRYNNPRPR